MKIDTDRVTKECVKDISDAQAWVEEGGDDGGKGARPRLQEPQHLQHQGVQHLQYEGVDNLQHQGAQCVLSLSSRFSVTISVSLDLDFCQ